MMGSLSKVVIGMLSGIIIARFVTPYELGAFQTVTLLFSYTAFMHLGVFNGLNRNFAFFTGKGDPLKAQRMVNASLRMAHIVSIAQVIVGIAYSFWLFVASSSNLLFWGSVSLIPILLVSPYSIHYDTLYRTSQSFRMLGIIYFIEAVFTALTIALVWYYNFLGLLLRNLMLMFVEFLLKYKFVPVHANGKGSFSDIIELIQVGSPILISGYIFSILGVADRTIIAFWKGPQAVGIYALAGIVITGLMVIPNTIGPILYSKASASYGQSESPASMRRYIGISLLMNTFLTIPVVILAYFLIEPMVALFLPAYIEGVPAAKVSLLTGISLALSGPAIIFGTMRKNSVYIAMLSMALGTIWLVGSWSLNRFDNIIYVAWTRATVSFALSAAIIFYALHISRLQASISLHEKAS